MALMFNKELTLEQRLEKNVGVIMGVVTALAPMVMIGKREVSETIPTAATNGRDEWYGRKFCGDLSDAELRFVILHECYHKMFKHLITWRHLWKLNKQKANMSCDYVINLLIWQAYGYMKHNNNPFITRPESILYDEQYMGMSAAEVFALLPDGNDEGEGNDEGSMDDHMWDDAQDMGEEERKELEREISSAIKQGELAASKMGTAGNPHAKDALAAKVDWRAAIRTFTTATCAGSDMSTWAKLNRRYLSGGYTMPSTYSKQTKELVIGVDASGSTFGEVMAQFMGEIQRISTTLKVKRIRILYWDTKVTQAETYEHRNISTMKQSTKPKGGGGTNVECIPEYLREHKIVPSAVIVLTDGFLAGSWGKWGSVPLLWCIVNNKNAKPNVGKAIHVSTN